MVTNNMSNYTRRMNKKAKEARIQNIIGRPPFRRFLQIVDERMLPDCPIRREDVIAAEKILGPNVGGLKGHTTRRASPETHDVQVESVPPSIMEVHRNVILAMDLMFINRIPFLVTISKGLKFGTVTHILNKKDTTVISALKHIKTMYEFRGFWINICKADYAFESMQEKMEEMGLGLNTTAENEHVAEIEWYIRTIKERTRAVYNMLPFKHFPGQLVVEMIMSQVYWMNSFPAVDGAIRSIKPKIHHDRY